MNKNDYYKNDFVNAMFYEALRKDLKLVVQTSAGTYIGYPADGPLNDDDFENTTVQFLKLRSLHDPDFDPTSPGSVMKSITLTDVIELGSNSSTKIPSKHLIIFVSDISGIALT